MSAIVEQRACRACNCPLMFVTGPNGKIIPLDTRAPVYMLGKDLMGNETAIRVTTAYPSHFSTCPSAPQFSKSRKR